MADISKNKYQEYADKIVSLLKDDQFYEGYRNRVKAGRNTFELLRRRHKQVIDMTWVNNIEECIVSLDNIVRNPRKFIVQEEDIVDISLARSISTESVKHLAQHTNLIAQVDKNGDVTPNKILNTSKEESFEIYENRFIYTLLRNVKNFINIRFDKIKAACALKDSLQLSVNSNFVVSNHQLSVKLDCVAQMSFDDLMKTSNEELTDIERVAKLDRIISDFLASPFAKQMVSCAPVRPPIQRTNVILKNPDFKKALLLWQFIENYREDGFKLVDEVSSSKLEDQQSISNLTDIITLNSFIFETLANGQEVQVGEEGYTEELTVLSQPDIILPEAVEQPEEEEEKQEDQPEETQEEIEESEEVEQPEEPAQEPEEESEQEPEIEEREEKEFIGDDNLYPFEVKKLYKRPEDDRVSPEEVKAINSALDRVLDKYKQSRTEEQISAAIINREKRKSLESISIDRVRRARADELDRLSIVKDITKLRTVSGELDKQYKILRELESVREDLHVEIALEKEPLRLEDLHTEDEQLSSRIAVIKERIEALNNERIMLASSRAVSDTEADNVAEPVEEQLVEIEPLEVEEQGIDNIEAEESEEHSDIEEESAEEVIQPIKKESVELEFDEEGHLIELSEEDQHQVALDEEPEEEPSYEYILSEVLPEDSQIVDNLDDDKSADSDNMSDEDILRNILGDSFENNSAVAEVVTENEELDEDNEDKFLLARRMINTRYVRNRSKGVDESDEALRILDSIYNSPKADIND